MSLSSVYFGGECQTLEFSIPRAFVESVFQTTAGRAGTAPEIAAVYEDLMREIPQLVNTLIRTRAAYGIGQEIEDPACVAGGP